MICIIFLLQENGQNLISMWGETQKKNGMAQLVNLETAKGMFPVKDNPVEGNLFDQSKE